MFRTARAVAGALTALALAAGVAAPASAEIEVTGFTADILDAGGSPETRAGARPHVAENVIDIAGDGTGFGVTGSLKEVVVEMPVGFVGDPTRIPTCTTFQLSTLSCPRASQIGMFHMQTPFVLLSSPMYNMDVPVGQAARFGTAVLSGSALVYFDASVRPEDNGITVTSSDISHVLPIQQTRVELWGVPADSAHDAERGGPAGVDPVPFLTMPTSCGDAPVTRMRANSWQDPDAWSEREFAGPPLEGCASLDFRPDVKVQPDSTAAGAPAGYTVELTQRLSDSALSLASAHVKDVEVSLPEGVAINPGAADGLATCSEGQFGLGLAGGPECPAASRIGEVVVETPLLGEPLRGGVYQAAQGANPFGSTFAIYLAPGSERYGVQLKLAGEVRTDPVTGRVTTVFENNPQQPFTKLTLRLKGGERAVLVNPPSCGPKTTEWSMRSWAQPAAAVAGSDTFGIDCGGATSFDPAFAAGSTNPVAGGYSPFVARFTRSGGTELGHVELDLPPGLLAKVAGVEVCGEAQLVAAAGRSGREVQAAGSCPAGSQVGTATVGVGAGATPFFPLIGGTEVSGRVFLTGAHTATQFPSPGASHTAYGLAIEVPAVAGPFDLGNVMVRTAIYADRRSGQLTAISDRLPRILDGVPLNLRDVRVAIDRDGFTVNPTSCAEQRVAGVVAGRDGARVQRSSRFQVADCAALGFGPRLGLALKGRRQAKTGGHPAVRAVVRQPVGQVAGIRRARVVLPGSLALDPDNANALCEYADGTKPDLENHCPAGSKVGRARVKTPLLDEDLVGDVFFVKNIRRDRETGNEIRTLPMLVVALRGQIDINLVGKASTARNGRLVSTFAGVPDAPIRRFNLNIRGGNAGILAVTGSRRGDIDLCDRPRGHLANTTMVGHNGKRNRFRTRVKTPCATRTAESRRNG